MSTHYSLFVKTDFGVPSCTVDFDYEFAEKRFTNIKVVNLAADISYVVDTYFPVKGTMLLQANNTFNNSGIDDDYASDISITILQENKMICCQILGKKSWNLETVDNGGTYELVECN